MVSMLWIQIKNKAKKLKIQSKAESKK